MRLSPSSPTTIRPPRWSGWNGRRARRCRRLPRLGPQRPELERDDVRELIVSPYRVIYRRRAEVVEIASIRHGAREFDAGVT